MKVNVDGNITSPAGFKAAGVHAGFRRNTEKLDLALVVADEPCAAAGVFTQNVFCAAPVVFSKDQFERSSADPGYGIAKAIIINSGNANAATGQKGLEDCRYEADLVSDAIGCPSDEVLVASTGVIGVPIPLEPFNEGVPKAVEALSVEGAKDAAMAILTTDTYEKHASVQFEVKAVDGSSKSYTIGGMAKGSGMIMPNMATMIAVLTTDAPVKAPDLHACLKRAVSKSFNKVTVDSDTSTNDTCFILSSGSSDHLEPGTAACDAFEEALGTLCIHIAKAMAADGEGATRLIEVTVEGAATEEDADLAARTVANSPLVKTAVAGRDANWGRIAAALGRSGAKFDQRDVDIDIMGIPVCRGGLTQSFDEDEALKRFEDPEIKIFADLNAGDCATTIWTCDLTHDYISINADYRT